jgi:hypothetical protein
MGNPDSQGHIINDPYPTPFNSGGFDLDAVGVMYLSAEGIEEPVKGIAVSAYPNPCTGVLHITSNGSVLSRVKITDLSGKIVCDVSPDTEKITLDLGNISGGIYFAEYTFRDGSVQTGKIVRR